ncbi:hypothetical protein ACHAXA_002001 [Cyclostephanos tholiformis]|jgi:nicotinate-nucleotide pyrophosphorylase (carboxylating)|uniref:Nicotinate-nucleotide pyrophosphorylase [carboxylating] n=1 Tax=Cyclostephanos tholiformis TaxID=382380 RepID=A0ABD3RZL7_9STRA
MVSPTDNGAAATKAAEGPAPGHTPGVVDSRCPTEIYFEENGRSLKLLVALCRGLKDANGNYVLEPDTDPFWSSLGPRIRRPTAEGWHAEIRRRWETFVGARYRSCPNDPRLGPRPNGWKLQKVLQWLDDNPIDAIEDVAYLVSMVSRFEGEERERRVELAAKDGPLPMKREREVADEQLRAKREREAAAAATLAGAISKRSTSLGFEQPPPRVNNGFPSSSSKQSLRVDGAMITRPRAPHSSLLPPPQIHSIVSAWLRDDIPSHFDVGGYVVGSSIKRAELWMKSPGILAGMPFFDAVFAACGGCTVRWEEFAIEGEPYNFPAGGKVKLATVIGPVSHLLRGERTALNSLSRCSGVATLSRECVRIARSRGWKGEVAGTRKTTPGFRLVEKYGLLVGGASTHRLDLSQMVMLKDNHVWSCGGSIDAAVRKARDVSGFSQKIEVECQSLEEALIAAGAGADVVMLDNFTPDRLRADAKAFKERYPHVKVEASGGITIDTMADYFSEHVDVISQGALTQGYDCVDFSLKIIQ